MENVKFLKFAETLQKIEKTSKRLEMQEILSDFLNDVIKNDPNSLVPVLFMSVAMVYPEFKNIELGIGESAIQAVLVQCTGLSLKEISRQFKETGDYGNIAEKHRVTQLSLIKKKPMSCQEVFDGLKRICRTLGKNSSADKKKIMLGLLANASAVESKFLIRLFETKLKIGLALQTVLISLAMAFGEADASAVKIAYNKMPDFERVVNLVFKHGIENLEEHARIQTGVPLKPMLAKPIVHFSAALAKFEGKEFLAEYKYDGERVQIHGSLSDNAKRQQDHFFTKEVQENEEKLLVQIYSRNNEESSIKFPDVASLHFSEKSFILDGEVVAFKNGQILPFQVLSTRKRKNIGKIEVDVCVFVFDILFFDGIELVDLSFSERRKILRDNFKEIPEKLLFAGGKICNSLEDTEEFFKKSLEEKCEGLMLKDLSSVYVPSKRTNAWTKLKKDYLENLGDSMDLVVIGAFYGKGKRTGTYGNFLLAAYNDEMDKFEACCKIGTGFTDQNLSDFYGKLKVTADTSEIVTGLIPDVYIEPTVVWEVKAASLSVSPIYKAGCGSDGKGISLRFPRFIRERDDKKPQDATSSNQLSMMYQEEMKSGTESESDEFN